MKTIGILAVGFVLFAATPTLADPIIHGASGMTVEATSSTGAYVSFALNATDATDTTDAVTCAPISGSLFGLGTTTVSCTSSDSSFATSTATFDVGVIDTTPPAITPPPDQSFATSTFPAFPTLLAATVTDLVDSTPTVTYSPTSFSLGTTTVTWTATDDSGNSAATTSEVVITDSTATPAPVSIDLQIYTSTSTLFAGTMTVSACAESPGSATSTVNGMCAIEQAAQANGFNTTWQWFSSGAALVSAGGEGDWSNGPWFTTFSGNQPLFDSLSEHTLSPNEDLLITDGPMPLELSVSTTSPEVNATTTVTVLGFNDNDFAYEPVSGAAINGAGATTSADGTVDITATSSDPFTVSASASGFLVSTSTVITPFAVSPNSNNSGGGGGGGGGGGISHTSFDLQSALSYLALHQNSDGSFDDSSLYTDWAAMAFAAAGDAAPLAKIKTYELNSQPSLSSAADYERHAMALEALGINPYSGTSVNYIAPIIADFDGTQIGSVSEDNDDIFALFALLHAGYSSSDPTIQKEVAFIISKQKSDGSWDESPDLTAAAIDALGPLVTDPQTAGQVLGAGVGYLLSPSVHNSDGGWGNVDSTSWVQTAINGIILAQTPGFSSESAFASSAGYYPTDALAAAQQGNNGAVQPASASTDFRVWSTSYAALAASGKDWSTLLQSFSKPSSTSLGGGGADDTATSTATSTLASATSTVATATSTALLATSTPLTLATTSVPKIAPNDASSTLHVTKAVEKPAPTLHTMASATTTPRVPMLQTNAQTAAASAAQPQSGGLLGSVWHAVVSFFSHFF